MEHPPGWTCHRTELQFAHYVRGTLVLAEALAVAEHVEACAGCAQRLVLVRLTIIEPING